MGEHKEKRVLGGQSQRFPITKLSPLWCEHPAVGTHSSCLKQGCTATQLFQRDG